MKDVPDDIYQIAAWCRSQGDEIIFIEAEQAVVNGRVMSLTDMVEWAGERYRKSIPVLLS